MTRIYFKPQGASNRGSSSNKARKPYPKGTQLHQNQNQQQKQEVLKQNGDAQGRSDGWRSKLEPTSIEQIADGLEKMVLSWTHQPNKGQHHHLDADDGHGHGHGDDDHSLLSSDAIKSATMEMLEDGEFSIGTKETTISFIHHHQKQLHQRCQPHQHRQQTLIVDTLGNADGFMQDIMRGDVIKNSLLSIQNSECDVIDYQMGSAVGAASALWYLTPTLALPNTVNYGKDYVKTQETGGDFQATVCDDDDEGYGVAHDKNVKQGERRGKCNVEDGDGAGAGGEKWQDDSTASEKISCKLETGGSKTWSETVEINGGNKIKDLLGKKLAALGNGFLSSQGTEKLNSDYYKKKVEELQIALLECAMEYEVKIVEMKMKALQAKSHERLIEPFKEKSREELENGHGDKLKERRDAQRVEYLKKQLSRLQREKAVAARELNDLKKRERQFDLQRRSLDDALSRVNFLQSELAKKEQDILDCRLREKEAKAQLYELQSGLQKAQAAQIEPRKLLTLLPALKDWIQSSKKGPYELVRADHSEKIDHTPPIDNIVYAITKEIQMLQNALSHVTNKT